MGFLGELGGLLGSIPGLGTMIGGGILSDHDPDKQKAQDELQKWQQELAGLQIPDIEKQKVIAQLLGNPEALGQSEMAKVDPRTKAAQMAALSQLQQEATSGGLGAMDKAKMLEAQNTVDQQERGQRSALLQSMAARGMGGSGASLAAQLEGQQGAAQRLNMAGTQAAGDAQRRALEAMLQGGQMAGQVRGQDMQAAAAQDAINRFNTANRIDTQRYNNDLQNRANYYNSGLYQQQYDNQVRKYGLDASMHQGQVNLDNDRYNQSQDRGAAVGGMLMNLAGSLATGGIPIPKVGGQQPAQSQQQPRGPGPWADGYKDPYAGYGY